MDTNPFVRILALSATPGGSIEAVQNVINNLHISHIECRDEDSPDVAGYLNEKVTVPATEEDALECDTELPDSEPTHR